MIILHGQPKSTQTIYKYACRGNHPCMYMNKEGKDLKEDYQWQAKSQWKEAPCKGPMIVTVKFYFGDLKKRDIDNFCKLWQDAFTGIVYEDDSQIVEKHIYKYVDKMMPRIEVDIKKL